MSIQLSQSQLPAIKRGIQLLRKVDKFHGGDFYSTTSLSKIQKVISNAYGYGSWEELVANATEQSCSVYQFDYALQVLLSNQIIRHLDTKFGVGKYQHLLTAIKLINWFPAYESGMNRLSEVAEKIVRDSEISYVIDGRSVLLKVPGYDLRLLYPYATESGFSDLSDLAYVMDDLMLFHDMHSSSSKDFHIFRLEFNDNFHNFSLLPQFCAADVSDYVDDNRSPVSLLIRSEFSGSWCNLSLLYRSNCRGDYNRQMEKFGFVDTVSETSLLYSMFGKDEPALEWLTVCA